MAISVEQIKPIFEKIQDKIRDQDGGGRVICAVDISRHTPRLIALEEYIILLTWLQENKIGYSENKNDADASQAIKLFMPVVDDHWLVFHCSKRILKERVYAQPPTVKATDFALRIAPVS